MKDQDTSMRRLCKDYIGSARDGTHLDQVAYVGVMYNLDSFLRDGNG